MSLHHSIKLTEAGNLPADWQVKSLREVTDFTNGKPHESDIRADGRFSLITLDSVDIKGELKSTHRATDVWDESLRSGDIVSVLSDLAHGLLLGLSAVVPEDNAYVLNQRMGRLRLKVAASPHYVRLQINRNQEHFRKRGQGTSQRHIYRRDFDALVIPLPELAEQRAIADAIGDVDALLAGLDRLIAKKRDLKRAAMQQLLTGQTRLPGFQEVWEVKRLGDLGVFLKGSGVKKDESHGGDLPCVRYGEIYTHHHDCIRSFNSWISHDVARAATRLKSGDLLFAGSGETKAEIGKCVAFVQECEAYAGGDIVILRPLGVDPMFMGYYCNTSPINAQKASRGQGDAVVHIGAAALAAIAVNLPTQAEQTAIARVLSDMDAELTALEARRDKTRALKQAMMQELLTGRTRLA